jgi:hypothetical protein
LSSLVLRLALICPFCAVISSLMLLYGPAASEPKWFIMTASLVSIIPPAAFLHGLAIPESSWSILGMLNTVRMKRGIWRKRKQGLVAVALLSTLQSEGQGMRPPLKKAIACVELTQGLKKIVLAHRVR